MQIKGPSFFKILLAEKNNLYFLVEADYSLEPAKHQHIVMFFLPTP